MEAPERHLAAEEGEQPVSERDYQAIVNYALARLDRGPGLAQLLSADALSPSTYQYLRGLAYTPDQIEDIDRALRGEGGKTVWGGFARCGGGVHATEYEGVFRAAFRALRPDLIPYAQDFRLQPILQDCRTYLDLVGNSPVTLPPGWVYRSGFPTAEWFSQAWYDTFQSYVVLTTQDPFSPGQTEHRLPEFLPGAAGSPWRPSLGAPPTLIEWVTWAIETLHLTLPLAIVAESGYLTEDPPDEPDPVDPVDPPTSTLEVRVTAIEDEQMRLSGDISAIDSDITTLREDLKAVEENLRDDIKAGEEDINSTRYLVDELAASVRSLEDRIGAIDSAIVDDVDSLQWLIDELTVRVAALEEKLATPKPEEPDPDEPDPTKTLIEGVFVPSRHEEVRVVGPISMPQAAGLRGTSTVKVAADFGSNPIGPGTHVLAWLTPDTRRQNDDPVYVVARNRGREVILRSRKVELGRWTAPQGSLTPRRVQVRVYISRDDYDVVVVGDGYTLIAKSGLPRGPGGPDLNRDQFLWLSAPTSSNPEVPSIGATFTYSIEGDY